MVAVRAVSWLRTALVAAGVAVGVAACATAPPPRSALLSGRLADGRPRAYNRPYQVRGRWYTPADQPGYDRVGVASWYSYESSSKTTADGERFDARLATAAHTTLPIPSWLEVTNLDNGRSARVRLNDRGPFASGRILDLSRAAALELGFLGRGTARVRVRYLGPAEPFGSNPPRWARAEPQRPAPATEPAMALAQAHEDAPLLQDAREEVREDVAATAQEGASPQAASDVTVLTSTASPARGLPEAEAAGFTVQVGAFTDRRNAERAAERLGSTGRVSVLPLVRPRGAVLYRVMIGEWPQAGDAASACAHIAGLGFADAKVVAR